MYEVVEKYASLYSDRKDIGGFLGQRSEIKGRMEDGGMWRNFSEDKTCYILIEVVGIRGIRKKNWLLSAAKKMSEEYQFWHPDYGLLASRTVKQYIFVI